MMSPPDALRARILAAAAASPSPTRPQGRRTALAMVGASLAVAAALSERAGGLAHGAGRPLPITLAIAAGGAAAAALLTLVVLGRGRSTLPRRPALLAASALVAPVALLGWLIAFHGSYVEPFERVGVRCLAFTLVLAATPLAAFLWLRRGIEPRRPSALGAAAGAACGAWAGVVVDLWCPLSAPAHALVGHALPLALLVLFGAALGRRTLGVRPLASRGAR
jgi:hypothetical protein